MYAIADRERLGERPLAEAVAAMASAGVGWIQVRAKRATGREWLAEVERCLRALEGSGAVLWIDDRVDVATVLPVAGVHLGQDDLPPAAARRVAGPDRWIGWSTHGPSQVAAATADRAVDVVAIGPVYPTRSKANPDPVVGPAMVREARRLTAKPLVAIGGIDAENLAEVLAAGADAVAVIGAACVPDPETACRRLVRAAEAARR